MVQIFWRSVYFQFLSEKCCITSTLALCKPLQVQWGNTHIIFLPSMDSKSYSSNLSSFVQLPVIGPPFKLISGDNFSSPSRVMDKVQRVDHADQNVAWNHYILSPRIISLLGHFMSKDELCHGFFLRWTNFYFSKSMNDLFWTEPILPMRSPLALNLKILTYLLGLF